MLWLQSHLGFTGVSACGAGVGQGGQGKAGIVGIGILVGFLCSG